MLQSDQFQMRISPKEKAMLASVAKHFERSQADTLKLLVRNTYRLIEAEQSAEKESTQEEIKTA
jgi:hypothetical protein